MRLPSKPAPAIDPAKLEAFARGMAAVFAELKKRGLGAGKPGHGGMPCPLPGCRGRVAFIAYVNGMVMAACNQRGCLNRTTGADSVPS